MYDVWKNALAEIEQQISPANFSTWFQDTSLISTKDGNIKIGVKNTFYVKQLRNRYYDLISTALQNNRVTVDTITFEVKSSNKSKIRSREVIKNTVITKKPISPSRSFKPDSIKHNGLNQKYSLDNFIVGSNNDVAEIGRAHV